MLSRTIAVFLLVSGSVVFGQESRGTITGRIVDPAGAVVSGAEVEAQNVATGTIARSLSNESGTFEMPYLLPGAYQLTVKAAGFKSAIRSGVELRVNDRLAIDFAMELGSVTESIAVTAEAGILETTNASVGIVMDSRRVAELPVVGGNPFYLSRLAPGVLSSGGRSAGNSMDRGAATAIVVNGTRSNSSEISLDGSPNMFERSGAFSPPQDLVQEFKIHTAGYDASIGHAAGAVTNVSMKSGSNAVHGTGYYFDSRLRAVPWFTNRFIYDPTTGPITPEKKERALEGWRHRRWGVTLSGPVQIPKLYSGRNRTFWTFGYEGLSILRNLGFTATVPTLKQRQGDFSDLLALGSRYQIYDPATIAPAANGRFSRQPLPGNIVPANRIDPIARNLLQFWPEPNQPGTADFRQNYYRTQDIDRTNRTFVSRVDHNFRDNNRFFARVNHDRQHDLTQTLPTIAAGNVTDHTGYGLVMDDVHIFSPQLLLNVRYGITYARPEATRLTQGMDLTSLGFSQQLVNELNTKSNPEGIAFPQVVVDGSAYTNLGNTGGQSRSVYYQTFGGTLTKIAGSHSLRIGSEYRLMRENGIDYGSVAPRLDFGAAWTRGPLDNSPTAPIGQGLASMLLGIPTGGVVNVNASRAQQSTYTAFFLQDDWRMTSKLTVNLGLRYEYEAAPTERFDRSIRGFDFETANPISQQASANYARAPIPEVPPSTFETPGGLRFAGADGQPRTLWRPDRNNFAPRIGIAWQLARRTVLRAGYGFFYDVVGIDRNDVNQGGFNQPTNIVPSLDNGLSFRATLANPFPDGLDVPTGSSQGLATFLGRQVSFFNSQPLNPYMQRWSFSVQTELPGRILIDTSYVGNRGNKLGVERNLNPVPREYLSTSPVRDDRTIDFLSAQVNSPFFGIQPFTGTPLGNLRVNRAQLLRPYPHFQNILATEPIGFSWYHSLQFGAEKRFSKGLTFQVSWTWSKFMEAISFLNDTDGVPERVVSDQDFPHRLVVSGIYDLPFGRGRKLFGSAPSLVNAFIGGWQLQGWFEGQSGPALGFGNAIFFGDLHDIPLPVGQRRAERWFNVDAGFERDNAKQLTTSGIESNVRTLSSRFTGVRADGINNWDVSMFKNFAIREGMKLQFRLETYNTLNHVQFGEPNTAPANTAFGSITGEKGHGQRQITTGIKLIF